MLSVLAPLAAAVLTLQDPVAGVAQDLAQERAARISQVRYELGFELWKGMDEVLGTATLRFALVDAAQPLVVDFGGTSIEVTAVNGRAPAQGEVRRVHDHLVLAPALLKKGENEVRTGFRSPVAATGTPLTRYLDEVDGAEYLYTLVVPADAHRLFPCFDQPDLKARVSLELELPGEWESVANGRRQEIEILEGDRGRHEFAETPPLPTYLIAFATGPFRTIWGPKGLRMFVRPAKVEWLDRERLFAMHAQALAALGELFGVDYPFAKLDLVLVPGFPYGGMEHAGAIFYRETALVFDHEPTEAELSRRSTLIYHEVAHQWFGNLVTMEWFDDLWLKEGFATLLAYQLLDRLEPDRLAWLRFHQGVKPAGLRVDATPGTVPVWQQLRNLDEAKSAYGPIVYNKAPGVLRELRHRLGEKAFATGLRAYLRDFAWSNATWSDLVAALSQASGQDLQAWSERWILSAGMPRVRVSWSMDAEGDLIDFRLRQEDVQGQGRTWPLAVEVLVQPARGERRRVDVRFDGPEVEVKDLLGTPAPLWVLLNPGDVAYGQFLPDDSSSSALRKLLPGEGDRMLRATGFSALYDAVREAELDPAEFATFAIEMLATERDALTHAQMLGALGNTLSRYLPEERAAPLRARAERMLRGQLLAGELPGLELQVVRALAGFGHDAETLELWQVLLDGTTAVPGLAALGTEDRFGLWTACVAAQAPGAREALAEASRGDAPDVARSAFLARAATPDKAVKAEYFATYLDPDGPPEQWVQGSLGGFHWPGQEALTLPYLRKALDAVERVKAERKIFFMPAWLDAFVNGHSSPEALAIVEAFLEERTDLPVDVRRKLLQSVDGLRRAVRIRARWAEAARSR